MSDELWGVVVGGLLASIVPVLTIALDGRKWRREQKFELLKSERLRKEGLYTKILEDLSTAMAKNSYPSLISSEIMVTLPKEASDRFNEWMKEKSKDDLKAKHAYFDMCLILKKDLAALDARILEHVS